MGDREKAIKKVEAGVKKADDCFQLAKAERASADQHHDVAAKLIKLGNSLEDDAVTLAGEIELPPKSARK